MCADGRCTPEAAGVGRRVEPGLSSALTQFALVFTKYWLRSRTQRTGVRVRKYPPNFFRTFNYIFLCYFHRFPLKLGFHGILPPEVGLA